MHTVTPKRLFLTWMIESLFLIAILIACAIRSQKSDASNPEFEKKAFNCSESSTASSSIYAFKPTGAGYQLSCLNKAKPASIALNGADIKITKIDDLGAFQFDLGSAKSKMEVHVKVVGGNSELSIRSPQLNISRSHLTCTIAQI